MAQRKKDGIREAILAASFRLFSEHGYGATSIPAIARAAGISTANVYVYFDSKLQMLFASYEPWLRERLDRLDRTLARIDDPAKRLERLLITLWRALPRDDTRFAQNVMQALSAAPDSQDYSPGLRRYFQARVAGWLAQCLSQSRSDSKTIAGVVLMAFDGFAMNARLAHGVACDTRTARLFASALLHSARADAASGGRPEAAAIQGARAARLQRVPLRVA